MIPSSTTISTVSVTSTATLLQRTTSAALASSTTITVIPTTSFAACDMQDVMADVVFLFDSSNGLTIPEFKDVRSYLKLSLKNQRFQTVLNFLPFMSKVKFGGNYVRAVLGTYDAQPHFSDDFFSLNSSSDYTNKIFDIWGQPQTNVVGNNIEEYADVSFLKFNKFLNLVP